MFKTCKCGCGLPVGKRSDYFNAVHKQRAYRSRVRNQKRALSRYVVAELLFLVGEKKTDEITTYLSRVSGDKNQYEIGKALAVLVTAIKVEHAS